MTGSGGRDCMDQAQTVNLASEQVATGVEGM